MSRISTDGPDVSGVNPADSASDAPVFMSRREARAAREAAQGKPVVAAAVHETISPEVVVTSEIAVPQIPVAPAAVAHEAAPVRYTPVAPPSSHTVKAKLKRVRKSPFHAVASMAVIGGLFVVTGLPAYGQSDLVSDEGTLASVAAVADALPASVQSITVSAELDFPELERDQFEATSPEDLVVIQQQDAIASANALYAASGAQALGDDYPWPTAGTSLSPLNYYYRQCTDFVAWRLNRDVGSFAAPFRWAWADLTPSGGDAYQWQSAWQAHGWTVSATPVAGSVAWFGWENHVAYVKQVNADGSVLLEEYNYVALSYGQRTIPASEVESFLYPPGQ
ncbi:CHAP domain-containing protein [Salinibacterium sp. NK8237]|uniref:CHAP domain-containing protein n=1 Tax=Salinibacterium sp. NK8237 TaxID=2792038 RepID=UPI0018CD91D5|nr:CHAP domain-containing protein [Salinibacterium sp. NK8237]MBH0129700.1 CHAP domain-containing protein [Salinibacterium sp. NK8237]